MLELFNRHAADGLRTGHLRQQETHFRFVFRLAQAQQAVDGGQHVARHGRDAVHALLRIPGQQLVRAQAQQDRFQAFRQQIRQFRIDIGARIGRRGRIGSQLAQHQQAHQHAVETAVEQSRKHLQQGLRPLQVKYLLDFIGRNIGLEMRLQGIVMLLLCLICIRSHGCTCHYINHSFPDECSAGGAAG